MAFRELEKVGHYEVHDVTPGEAEGTYDRVYIPPTEMEKAVHNIAIAEQNQAVATIEAANNFGMIMANAMQKFGDKLCNQLGDIADEMRRARLTQEYFNIMNKISECAVVLDEETVKSNLNEVKNVTFKKMTEHEIMFLVLNFKNENLCKKIKMMALKKGISAYELGKELLKSAVILETIYNEIIYGKMMELADFCFCILQDGDLEKISPLYFSKFKCAKYGYNSVELRTTEIEDFVKSPTYVNQETEELKKKWKIVYNIKPGLEDKIRDEYLDYWDKNSQNLTKERSIEWQMAYCEWEEFEKELEIDHMMNTLRRIAFNMQNAAILARFNKK